MRFVFSLILTFALLFSSNAQSLKVMTYNIRFDNPEDSVNTWPNRVTKVASLIRTHDPDVIGVQEALHHQLQDLVRLLPEYSYCGVGREDGKEKGEYSAILFRNSRFGLLTSNTLWLSETPEIPGSKSWDAALPRVLTSAKFYDKDLKSDFVVFNTHFDHIGKEARIHSASFLLGTVSGIRISNKDIPVIVIGDFNSERTEETYKSLHKAGVLIETKPINDATGTYCGFGVDGMECKIIDYIFHTKEWILRNYQVIHDNDGTYYPSDHLPVMVEFELSAGK